MLQRRKIIIPVICVLLTIAITVVSAVDTGKNHNGVYNTVLSGKYEMNSNRHTGYTPYKTVVSKLGLQDYENVLENETLALYYRESDVSLRIADKRTGYVWGTVEADDAQNLNENWLETASSVCTVTYFDKTNTERIVASSNSKVKFNAVKEGNRLNCSFVSKKIGISFNFSIELKDNSVTFKMDDSSIEESGSNILQSVYFMSFFGSSKEDSTDGYFVLPDGCGALMRFKKSQSFNMGYEKQVYGLDLGIDKSTELANLNGNRTDDYATDEYQATLPILGIVHGSNQNGVLITVDSGEEFATVNAHPAGLSNVEFNRAYISYKYRSLYNCRVSQSATVTVPQEEMNSVKASQTYHFLCKEKANYSAMAVYYRDLLKEKKILCENISNDAKETKLLLNIVCADVKKGFLKNSSQLLSTADGMKDMVETLKGYGIPNIDMILSGWLKGGYHGSSFGSLTFAKNVGSRDKILSLRDLIRKNGGDFALNLNTVTANKDQIRLTFHSALNATKDKICKTVPNDSLPYSDTYFIKPTKTLDYIKKINRELKEFDFCYEDLGKYLYSDYTPESSVARQRVISAQKKYFEKSKKKITLDYPNFYLLKYTKSLINTPIVCSQYLYETDSVPFLQIVLRGNVRYYAPYSNQGYYSKGAILKIIEYGAFPSFLLMNEDNFSLYNTQMVNCFSLCFDNWKDTVNTVYSSVSSALNKVANEEITEHTVIAEGVYKTLYSNGVSIYVNYNETEYTLDGGDRIDAVGYLVKDA